MGPHSEVEDATKSANDSSRTPKSRPKEPLAPTKLTSVNTIPVEDEQWIYDMAEETQSTPEFVRDMFRVPCYQMFPGSVILPHLMSAGAQLMHPYYSASTSAAKKVTLMLPRTAAYYPSVCTDPFQLYYDCISFSTNGVPGISLAQAMDSPLSQCCDNADDIVCEWGRSKKIRLQLDWSGLLLDPCTLRTHCDVSRGRLAQGAAGLFHWLMDGWNVHHFPVDSCYNVHPFSPKNVDLKSIRLFGVEKVGDLWIPKFGIDVKME